MNRAERRANGIKGKAPTYNLSADSLKALKEEYRRENFEDAFICMLALPTIVIRDKFGELMRKEAREEKFVNLVLKQFELFQQGYFTLEDLKQCLYEETGIKFENLKRGKLYE